MRVLIVGCGRVGAALAQMMDRDGHEVTVIDINPAAFNRLSSDFRGRMVLGNGIDEDVLRSAGVEQADAFASVTEGDNRNIMAAQIAREVFHVRRVITRVNDPVRTSVYHDLGLETICPTVMGTHMILERLKTAS
jgi:trk system potassium uptake protein TrkA